jgi:transcriptional pleiotropic regulator of transition state genes
MLTQGPESNAHHDVGTARQIDQLGRVVVPADLRKMAGLHSGDLLDFRFIDGHIAITKLEPECALCGSREHLADHLDKCICAECIQSIRETHSVLLAT